MAAFRPVRRDAARLYVSVAVLSFVASVSLTRLYLTLTGYPQIGNGTLHIAHALWGGLLLVMAAWLPLCIANRWVYSASAVLAGVGLGLFVDEVGKFITQRNDYFFPAAAPIIYIFFLLAILVFFNVRHFRDTDPDAELHRALEQIQQSLVHPLTAEERAILASRLRSMCDNCTSEKYADLGRALLEFVGDDELSSEQVQSGSRKWADWRISRALTSFASDERLRISLIIGLLALGLLTLKNPAHHLLAGWLPPDVNSILNIHVGRYYGAATAPFWYGIRIALESIVGVLFLISGGLLMFNRTWQGAALGYLALLVSLTAVDPLLYYFEQFSTVTTTFVHYLLLLVVLYYQRRLASRWPLPQDLYRALSKALGQQRTA